jgi:hypothetical protein
MFREVIARAENFSVFTSNIHISQFPLQILILIRLRT